MIALIPIPKMLVSMQKGSLLLDICNAGVVLRQLNRFPFWLDHLFTLLERITWGDSAVFTDFSLWLGCLSTFSGRMPQGDSAAFANLVLGFLRIWIFRVSTTPINPKPWYPCFISLREASSFSFSRLIFLTINWAIQTPVFISNWMSEWLINRTLTSPQ